MQCGNHRELLESGQCLCDGISKSRDYLYFGRDEISQVVSIHRWLETHHGSCGEFGEWPLVHRRHGSVRPVGYRHEKPRTRRGFK
jgi:hypothetical protein